MPRSLPILPPLLLALVLLPGLLEAQELATATTARVELQLGYDSTGSAVTADLDVTCPAGGTPSDVTWSWTSLIGDPLGVDQPVTGGPLKPGTEPGAEPGFRTLLPPAALGAMCARLQALQGGVGDTGGVVRISSAEGGLEAEIQGQLLVQGTCQPDGPRIHSAIRTTFTLVCGDDGDVEGIHSPSSNNEPSPPESQLQEAGFQLTLGEEEGRSLDGPDDRLGGGVLWRHGLAGPAGLPKSYFQLSLTRNQHDQPVELTTEPSLGDEILSPRSLEADFDLWHLDVSFGHRFLSPERRLVPFAEAGVGGVFVDRRGARPEDLELRIGGLGDAGSDVTLVPEDPDPFQGVDEDSLTVHAAVGGRLRITERCFLEGGVRSRWRDSTSTTTEEGFFRLTFGIK